jgi:hypothetical protein
MEGEGNSRRDVYCTVNVGTTGTGEGRLRGGGEGESGVKKGKRDGDRQTDRAKIPASCREIAVSGKDITRKRRNGRGWGGAVT